jgi:mono/diheme cytochrome c family protein
MTSCYYDQIEEVELPPDTVVEFAADIQPIFTQNCVECHNANRDPDLRAENAYNSLVPEYVTQGNADNSELYSVLSGGHGNISTAELARIELWINSGALNN